MSAWEQRGRLGGEDSSRCSRRAHRTRNSLSLSLSLSRGRPAVSRSHSRPGSVRSEQLLPQALESRSPRALLLSAARCPLARSVDGFQSVQCAGNPFHVLDVACSVSRPLRPRFFLAPRRYCAWQSTGKPRIRVSAARSSSPGHSRPAESWLPRSSAPEPRRRWCTAPSHRQVLNATCTGSRLVPATDNSRPRQWAKSCGKTGRMQSTATFGSRIECATRPLHPRQL